MSHEKTVLSGRFVLNGDAHVAPQRHAAYEYAELRPRGTRLAIPAPVGAEVHAQDGTIHPVPAGDWIVEAPDGNVAIVAADEIADWWEFVDGPEAYADAHAQTVANAEALKRADRAAAAVAVADDPMVPVRPHPDSGFAAAERDAARSASGDRSGNADEWLAFAQERRRVLEALVRTATERAQIDPGEGALWLEHGITPEGVNVRQDELTGSWVIERVVAAPEANDPGNTTAEPEGAPAEGLAGHSIQELWKLAKAEGVEPQGTGKDGAVRKDDLVRALSDAS